MQLPDLNSHDLQAIISLQHRAAALKNFSSLVEVQKKFASEEMSPWSEVEKAQPRVKPSGGKWAPMKLEVQSEWQLKCLRIPISNWCASYTKAAAGQRDARIWHSPDSFLRQLRHQLECTYGRWKYMSQKKKRLEILTMNRFWVTRSMGVGNFFNGHLFRFQRTWSSVIHFFQPVKIFIGFWLRCFI